jgi:hypothetical protein
LEAVCNGLELACGAEGLELGWVVPVTQDCDLRGPGVCREGLVVVQCYGSSTLLRMGKHTHACTYACMFLCARLQVCECAIESV